MSTQTCFSAPLACGISTGAQNRHSLTKSILALHRAECEQTFLSVDWSSQAHNAGPYKTGLNSAFGKDKYYTCWCGVGLGHLPPSLPLSFPSFLFPSLQARSQPQATSPAPIPWRHRWGGWWRRVNRLQQGKRCGEEKGKWRLQWMIWIPWCIHLQVGVKSINVPGAWEPRGLYHLSILLSFKVFQWKFYFCTGINSSLAAKESGCLDSVQVNNVGLEQCSWVPHSPERKQSIKENASVSKGEIMHCKSQSGEGVPTWCSGAQGLLLAILGQWGQGFNVKGWLYRVSEAL